MSKSDLSKTYSLPPQPGNPRATEAWALTQAALRMKAAQASAIVGELQAAARLNWRLWTILQSELLDPESPVPSEIRVNMLTLAGFVDRQHGRVPGRSAAAQAGRPDLDQPRAGGRPLHNAGGTGARRRRGDRRRRRAQAVHVDADLRHDLFPSSETADDVSARRLDALLRRVGSALAKGRAHRARGLCEAFLTRSPASPEGLFALALAAVLGGDYALAAASVARAGEAAPDVREIADLAAVIHGQAGDLNTAVYFGKLATTLPSNPRLAAILPSSLPSLAHVLHKITQHPFLDRASRASAAGDWPGAEHWYRQHLAFHPDSADGYARLAITLLKQGQARAAADVLRAARHRLPDDVAIATLLGKALTALGRFAEAQACHRWAVARAPGDAATAAAGLIDQLLDPASSPDVLAQRTRAWGAAFGLCAPSPSGRAVVEASARLTIGLLVGGEATSIAGAGLARILMHRDTTRFRIVGFGFGSLAEPANVPFQKAVEHWCDIPGGDPLTLAAMAEAEQIDIMLDLAGFTAPHLLPAFGRRMAPCQVAWMNAPYGTGLAAMDVLLTDGFVDPDPSGAGRYRETIAYLDLGCITALPDPARRTGAGSRPKPAMTASCCSLPTLLLPISTRRPSPAGRRSCTACPARSCCCATTTFGSRRRSTS